MAKISELQSLTDPQGRDFLWIGDKPSNSNTSTGKNITLKTLFGNVPANTSITGTLVVSGNTNFSGANSNFSGTTSTINLRTNGLTVQSNGIVIKNELTPANSSVSTITTGKIFFDSNYLYVKVSNTVIKRLSLQSF